MKLDRFRCGPTSRFVVYPLIPWIGVMAAATHSARSCGANAPNGGACFLWLGVAMTLAFVVMRATNLYGDPRPWTPQPRGAVFTFLSFLNRAKYPPSLLFLLMTLGPSIIVLALFDRDSGSFRDRFSSSAACRSSFTCCTCR